MQLVPLHRGVVFAVIIAHFFASQQTCEFADALGGRKDNVVRGCTEVELC